MTIPKFISGSYDFKPIELKKEMTQSQYDILERDRAFYKRQQIKEMERQGMTANEKRILKAIQEFRGDQVIRSRINKQSGR